MDNSSSDDKIKPVSFASDHAERVGNRRRREKCMDPKLKASVGAVIASALIFAALVYKIHQQNVAFTTNRITNQVVPQPEVNDNAPASMPAANRTDAAPMAADSSPPAPSVAGQATASASPQPSVRTPPQRPQVARSQQPAVVRGNGPGARDIARPDARDALSSVGVDPDAEAVWADAINDASVPPNERKDLIEDLNQDGFADPDHVTQDDLPLIQARISLIENIGPNAIDAVNAAAFQEAYKDLNNMAAQAAAN
jgi:hypothetical protein